MALVVKEPVEKVEKVVLEPVEKEQKVMVAQVEVQEVLVVQAEVVVHPVGALVVLVVEQEETYLVKKT